MGTAIDGVLDEDGSPAVERLQSFLNSAVQPDQQTALNDSPRLDVDGVLEADTWRTLQFLIMAWHREYLPAGWDFADWVDGEAGPATIGRSSGRSTTLAPTLAAFGDHRPKGKHVKALISDPFVTTVILGTLWP